VQGCALRSIDSVKKFCAPATKAALANNRRTRNAVTLLIVPGPERGFKTGPKAGIKHSHEVLFRPSETPKPPLGPQKTVKNCLLRPSERKNRPKLLLFYVWPLYTAREFPYHNYKTGQKCFKPACGAAMAVSPRKGRRVGSRIPVWNTP